MQITHWFVFYFDYAYLIRLCNVTKPSIWPLLLQSICKDTNARNYGSPGGTFLLISYHLLLTTYYLSLITYYLLLTTYYLLLITYHIISHPYNGGKLRCTFPVIAVEYGSPYLLLGSSSSSSSRKSGVAVAVVLVVLV